MKGMSTLPSNPSSAPRASQALSSRRISDGRRRSRYYGGFKANPAFRDDVKQARGTVGTVDRHIPAERASAAPRETESAYCILPLVPKRPG